MIIPKKMRSVYYDRFGKLPEIKEVDVPMIDDRSVLLKVMATGICRSDWHGWMGHDKDINLPHVPGHEFAGVITQVGARVEKWKLGQRVTTPFVQACGQCYYCLAGDQQVCERQEQAGFTHWGSFAEYVEVKNAATNLVELPESMDYEVAAVLGCRFGTAYRAVLDQAKIRRDDFLLVIGCGGVGLSAILIGRALGARVSAIDINANALYLAKECGAELVFPSLNDQVVRALHEWSDQRGVKACIDAIGKPELVDWGLRALRRKGKYIQVGLLPDIEGRPVVSMEKLVAFELEILGSHGIQGWKYQELLDFVVTSKLPISRMITKTCTLEESIPLLARMDQNQEFGVSMIDLQQ